MTIFFKNFLLSLKEHKYFLTSLIIAFFISAITWHGDFMVLSVIANKITLGHFDIYDKSLLTIMPPLIFFIDAFNLFLFKVAHVVNFTFTNIYEPVQWQVFILKMRYILIFILSYFLVIKTAKAYTSNDSDAKLIANLWITSPILLLLTFSQGNNDIYPAFFSFCFLYFVFKRQNIGALICLGLVAALKNYALMLIPFVTIILAEKNYKKAFFYALLILVVYCIPSLFYLHDIKLFFLANGEGTMILEAIIPSRVPYYVFIILYISSLLYLIFSDNEEEIKNRKNDLIISWCFLVVSFCFMLSFFLPQWVLWLIPFGIFITYKNVKLFSLLLLVYCVFFGITVIIFHDSLGINLFTPIYTRLHFSSINTHIIFSVWASLLIMLNYFQFKKIAQPRMSLDNKVVKYNYLPLLVYFALVFLVLIPQIFFV